MVNTEIRLAKDACYQNNFYVHTGDSKKIW